MRTARSLFFHFVIREMFWFRFHVHNPVETLEELTLQTKNSQQKKKGKKYIITLYNNILSIKYFI